MGIVFRQSIKTTLVIFAGTAMGAFINLAYTYVFTLPEVGFLNNIVSNGAVIQFIVLLGVAPTIQTYWQRLSAKPGKAPVLLSFGLLLPLAVIALLMTPYILFRPEIIHIYRPQDQPFLVRYYYFLPLLILIWTYISVLDAVLVAEYKTAVASFMREVVLRGGTLVALLLFFLRVLSFPQFVWAMLLVYLMPVLGMYLYARRLPQFGLTADWSRIAPKERREIVHFSWYHFLTGAATSLLGFLDTIMLGPLDKTGFAAVALYRWPVFLAVLIKIPYRAMVVASFPSLNEAYLRGDMQGLASLFRRTGVNILIAAVFMFVLIACNLHNVAAILPAAYAEVLPPLTLILMAGHLVDMATGVNEQVLSISAHYKWSFRISVLLVLMLVAFYRLLIPEYGVYGAAWGTTLALALFNILKGLLLYKKVRLQPFSAGTPRVLMAGVVAAGAGYAMPHLHAFAGGAAGQLSRRLLWIIGDAALRSLIILLAYGLMLLWTRPSPDLAGYLQSIKERKRLF